MKFSCWLKSCTQTKMPRGQDPGEVSVRSELFQENGYGDLPRRETHYGKLVKRIYSLCSK